MDKTHIEFFFDPACPFSWITSRWLLQVQAERDIDITWRQFSLALKNNELQEKDSDGKHAIAHRGSHRAHRVVHRATSQHGASMIELYSEFGIRFHIMEKPFDDDMIRDVLQAKNLPLDLLSAADDNSIDTELQTEIDSAVEAAGGDIGVPTIVFSGSDRQRVGYFGPVLNELPGRLEESLAMWDGLAVLATTSSFYELKRSRPGGNPNVFSAARC
ncbi:MAG: DsbA family protein [Candidatus Saccharimonadales bacterium]